MNAAVVPEASGLNGDDLSTGNRKRAAATRDDEASGLAGSLTTLFDGGRGRAADVHAID